MTRLADLRGREKRRRTRKKSKQEYWLLKYAMMI